MDVWMLDVGQGSCIVVDCPNNDRPLLIDCGSTTPSANNDEQETVDWISARLADWGAPTVVLSHGDKDHYNLVPRAVDPGATDGVWLGGARSEYTEDAFPAWARDVESAGGSVSTLPARYFGANDRDLHCGSDVIADILIANAAAPGEKNANSIVLALSYAGVTVVLAGDAEGRTSERQALANRATLPRLDATRTIIAGSHHGARTHDSNSLAWARAWSPYAVIFSQAETNYGHPACDVVVRYAGAMENAVNPHRVSCGRGGYRTTGTRTLTTQDSGDVLFRILPDRLLILCQTVREGCSGPLPTIPVS